VNKIVISVQEGMGGDQLSLIGWLNHKPVVFVAMARDRPAVVSFLSLFMSVMCGLVWVSYPRHHFLYENGGG